uniref:non-specific serine/threonine protein kinase n=1 Tax=Daucus carota subsp. sativus TaxID=79200 RepID=A0A175YHI1_DAUCS
MDRNPNPNPLRRSTSGGGSGGIILEKYQLGQILGRGSFAKVYRAKSLLDNANVAIKVIEKPAIADQTAESLLVREENCKSDVSVNAFDIISMSSGLDLSGLFEADLGKKERRFASRGSMKDVEERVERVSGELGYKVEKGKGREMGLVKGKMVLLVRILELVAKMGLLMVEMKVVSGGDELDKGDVDQLEALKLGLGDIAVSWHNNDVAVNA